MTNFSKIYRRVLDKHRPMTRMKLPTRNISKSKETRSEIHSTEKTFEKILIANRGEIACRIINTARKMGIKSVAVYSSADATSKHVKLADEAFWIGPPLAKYSYLDMDKILDATEKSGAHAVHPGYGFLSENANFVALLEKRNIAFVGPPAGAIAGMGDKLESKRLAAAAGVNTIPGFDGVIMDEDHCVEIARSIGYPVIIKASAGGGGKGMRIARSDKDSRDGFRLSTQEALASFGDDRVLVEKFIENPRHIEIQILGDKHGNIIHLNERECSIQRRNQKIIEEAPSTFLDKNTRKLMGRQAVALCSKIGYYSAGTVEFLVDAQRNFYFLEMNTRLQVEHPITECITGIDIVREMVRVAQGLPLDIKQEDVPINGWAIESRVYAEDPYKNFGMPSTGQLHAYKEPQFEGFRCDSGVEEGSLIGIHYDPMISKVICHGSTREEAVERSIRALDLYVIKGVAHNVPLLRDILAEDAFVKGDTDTDYLSRTYPDGFKGRRLDGKGRMKLLTVALGVYAMQELRNGLYLNGPSVKIHAKGCERWDLVVSLLQEQTAAIVSHVNSDSFEMQIEGETFRMRKDFSLAQSLVEYTVNDEPVVAQLVSKNPSGEFKISFQGTVFTLRILPKLAADLLQLVAKKPKASISTLIKSPMPGLITNVSCKAGDDVLEGQELCIVEAMKMQNSMVSAVNGRVKCVHVKAGDTVGSDDALVQLE